MYRDLGFIRVWGGLAHGPERDRNGRAESGAPYAYLIYPHRPIVAYLPQTRELLSEYCVEFPDETRPYGSARLRCFGSRPLMRPLAWGPAMWLS